MKSEQPDMVLSHFGLCVSDLERSLTFYTQALHFTPQETFLMGNETRTLVEIDADLDFSARFLARDGMRIELLCFRSPGPVGTGERRPVNRLGINHLSFRVDDVDVVTARVRQFGGRVLDHTRTGWINDGSVIDAVYCTDPDGIRIELFSAKA